MQTQNNIQNMPQLSHIKLNNSNEQSPYILSTNLTNFNNEPKLHINSSTTNEPKFQINSPTQLTQTITIKIKAKKRHKKIKKIK